MEGSDEAEAPQYLRGATAAVYLSPGELDVRLAPGFEFLADVEHASVDFDELLSWREYCAELSTLNAVGIRDLALSVVPCDAPPPVVFR